MTATRRNPPGPAPAVPSRRTLTQRHLVRAGDTAAVCGLYQPRYQAPGVEGVTCPRCLARAARQAALAAPEAPRCAFCQAPATVTRPAQAFAGGRPDALALCDDCDLCYGG